VNQPQRSKDNSSNFRAGLGGRIRCARVALGKTQEKLAADLGIARQTLIAHENGHTEMPSSILKRLCDDFALDAAWLLLGDVSRPMFAHDEAKVA
jgi:DNA-binding XRE family transcriptional regulator